MIRLNFLFCCCFWLLKRLSDGENGPARNVPYFRRMRPCSAMSDVIDIFRGATVGWGEKIRLLLLLYRPEVKAPGAPRRAALYNTDRQIDMGGKLHLHGLPSWNIPQQQRVSFFASEFGSAFHALASHNAVWSGAYPDHWIKVIISEISGLTSCFWLSFWGWAGWKLLHFVRALLGSVCINISIPDKVPIEVKCFFQRMIVYAGNRVDLSLYKTPNLRVGCSINHFPVKSIYNMQIFVY